MEKSWDELPNPKKVWIGQPGSHEEGLGRLVLLTPERVANAAQTQILTGRRVNLGWDLNKLEFACFDRQPCEMKMVPLLDGVAFDDIYVMNPQQSSQWDGLRHFSMPVEEGSSERVFYGGTTKEEILDRENDRIGIHHWAQEGVTGQFSPFSRFLSYTLTIQAEASSLTTHHGLKRRELNTQPFPNTPSNYPRFWKLQKNATSPSNAAIFSSSELVLSRNGRQEWTSAPSRPTPRPHPQNMQV